jgi:hypothetical protein
MSTSTATTEDVTLQEGVEEGEQDDSEGAEGTAIVLFAGKDFLLVDANGEVIGEQSAPADTADIEEIVGYLGPRLMRASARLVALETERAAMFEQIRRHYDPQITRAKSYQSWLKGAYLAPLRDLALDLLAGKKLRSVKVGLLTLKFKRKPARLEVVSESLAVNWAKLIYPEAVKTTGKFLVSQLPEAARAMYLNSATPPEVHTGLAVIEAADGFEVE